MGPSNRKCFKFIILEIEMYPRKSTCENDCCTTLLIEDIILRTACIISRVIIYVFGLPCFDIFLASFKNKQNFFKIKLSANMHLIAHCC